MFYFLDLPQSKILFDVFQRYSIEARFVGGCVRDAILGFRTDDFDIAVNCDILDVVRILQEENICCVPAGIKYGSVIAVIEGVKFDITELRKDKKCYGRKCDVERTSDFEDDARRRDFTINAIYVDQKGLVYDYFDGIEDLKSRRIIFIGDPETRIQEDYLRMFRYYRFAARFGDFSDRYSSAIRKFASESKTLSIERIQKELFLILETEYSLQILSQIKANELFLDMDLETYAELLKIDQNASLELRAYALFGYESLLKKFKLPKCFKLLIKEFKKFESRSLIYSVYKKDRAFAENLRIIKQLKFNENIELPDDIVFPEFPVKYANLPAGITFAARRLIACEEWWVNKFCKPNKAECLNFIDINPNF